MTGQVTLDDDVVFYVLGGTGLVANTTFSDGTVAPAKPRPGAKSET